MGNEILLQLIDNSPVVGVLIWLGVRLYRVINELSQAVDRLRQADEQIYARLDDHDRALRELRELETKNA